MSTEKEDLDQLIHSQGWLRMVQFAEKEWADRYDQHVRVAAGETDDLLALGKLRQIIAAKDAVRRLLRWPSDRLAELERTEKAYTSAEAMSRRGPL